VITDGLKGSYATDGENSWHMPIYPFTPVARTGAGDAYTSGFIGALLKGKDVPTSMQWGCANAGKVVQIFGAQKGLCSEYMIKKTVQTYKNIEPKML
jgi:ribokinase